MATFKPSYTGIGEMIRSPEVRAEMVRRAEKVKAQAEATAPYDAKSTTHYKDAFHVTSTSRGGKDKDRAAATVVNDDAAAFFIEWGNANITKHRTLGRALDAAKD